MTEPSNEQASDQYSLEVADDRLTAWIKIASNLNPSPVESGEVLGFLEGKQIEITDQVRRHVEEFVSSIANGGDVTERYLIAEGRPPVEGEDGTFQWDERFKKAADEWKGDAQVDFYTINSIVTVDEGDLVGRVSPAKAGKSGRNVLGEVLKPKRTPQEVQLEPTVRRGEGDTSEVHAEIAGRVVFEKQKISIDEVFVVAGDVDFKCGNINSSVEVRIHGTVQDLFEVASEKSLLVGGAVEAAKICVADDLTIRGGIFGRDKGEIKVGKDLVAKFCAEADLTVGGDIKVTKEVMASRVRCEGKLVALAGAVIGGEIYAREGVEVNTLGSDACVSTPVTVGIHPDVVRASEEVDEEVKARATACGKIRESIGPLLADIKRLSADQKERATELMFKADEIQMEIDEAIEQRDKMVADAKAKGIPYVLVTKMIHQGADIQIGRRHVLFHNDYDGPVKIEKRKVENVTEFVAVNQLSGSITVLPSSYMAEEEVEEVVVGAGDKA